MATRVTQRRTPDTGQIGFGAARQALEELARQMRASDPEGRERLLRVGEALVGAFRHATQLHASMRQFLREVVPELLPPWLREAADAPSIEPPAVVRARAIAQLLPEEQAAAIAHEGPGLFRELEALGRADLVASTVGLLAQLLGDRSAHCRAAACEAVLEVKGVLETATVGRARIEEAVRTSLDAEEDAATYPKLALIAVALIDAHLRAGELREAMPALELLRRHSQVKEGSFPRRAELAFQALERVATAGGFAVVQEHLREGDPEAMRVVDALDAAATRFLLGRIRASEGLADRVRFAETIARAGPGAAAIVLEAMQRTTAPSEALRLMEVLPSAIPERQVEVALEGLLRHAAIAVRRKAALMLAERGYPRAGGLLLRALSEETDPAVRATLAEALGLMRCREAVAVLLDAADGRQEADEVRSEACLALGRIADRAAIPVLVRLSEGGGGGISSIFRTVTREVRVAATRALGSFPADLAAREALRRANLDPIPGVRAAAKEAQDAQLPVAPVATTPPRDALATSWKLAGSLGEVPLDQICQLIAASTKSGLLTLQFEKRKARVWFDEGLVVAAEFEGKRDQEAFNLFCRRTGGHFSFRPGQKTEEKRMRAPVMNCLMEAYRVADESGKGGVA